MYIIITLSLVHLPSKTVHILILPNWLYRQPPSRTSQEGSSQQAPLIRCPSWQTDWSRPHMDSSQCPNN